MSNFYRVLGVTSGADNAQIKVAFRRLAKTFHPDLNPGDARAEERFRDINRAYATLRDPAARSIYDSECAHDRARTRRRWWSATLTMSACFAITLSSGLLVAAWMHVEAWNHISNDMPPVLSELDKGFPLALGISD